MLSITNELQLNISSQVDPLANSLGGVRHILTCRTIILNNFSEISLHSLFHLNYFLLSFFL